jgi:Xaa-Pro aminopeptidase
MSFGKMAVDWEERIDFERLRRDRLQKTTNAMKGLGLESLLLLNGENIRYVARGESVRIWMGVSGQRYSLVTQADKPLLYEASGRKEWVEQGSPWVDTKYAIPMVGSFPRDAYLHQASKFAAQIKSDLKDRGISSDTVGIDTSNPVIARELEKVGLKLSMEGAKAMNKARLTKTKEEVECLRMIASIIESIFSKFKAAVHAGVTETYLRGLTSQVAYAEGADWCPGVNINSGPHTWPLAISASDRALRPGDLIDAAMCGLQYNGYNSCYYRDFVCGRPTQSQKDAHAITRDLLNDAMKACKVGVYTKEIAEKWPSAEEFGRPNEDATFELELGHGIGMSAMEPPFFSRSISLQFPERLESGMTFALETIWPTKEENGYKQAVRLEQMIHLTDAGPELLTLWPIDEITECEL